VGGSSTPGALSGLIGWASVLKRSLDCTFPTKRTLEAEVLRARVPEPVRVLPIRELWKSTASPTAMSMLAPRAEVEGASLTDLRSAVVGTGT